MQTLKIGDVTITSIIERDGPWRRPEDMFPAYDPEVGRRHIAKLDPFVFDVASGRMVITYQTFIVRTPKRTILVDTCTGEDKGYPPPMDFPKQPWLDGFRAGGLRFEDIDYVFCTHLHIDHCGWNTCSATGGGSRLSRRQNTCFTSSSTPPGRKRLSAETIHPETSGALTVSRWSRPVRRCWSTMTFNLTTRFGSPPRRATRPAIAASISVRAVSVPSSSATSCTMRYSVESLIGLRSLIGTAIKRPGRDDGF
jgi:Metallo-beta-lactamase superfamily